MPPFSLSENEKAVLLSLMVNPEHSDKDRSGSLGMNIYTYNKIKNHLSRDGYLRREFVPNYGLLGFEILLISFGSRLEPYISDKAKDEIGKEVLDRAPTHLVLFMTQPGQGMGFHVIEDFTAMKNGLIRAERLIFDCLGMERSDMSIIPFSFRDMRVHKMFDLLNLVRFNFDLGIEIPVLPSSTNGQDVSSMSWDEYFRFGGQGRTLDLNDDEWDLMVHLVKYPNASDQFHMDELGISRYRYKRIRDLLFSERILKPLMIPDPSMIGLEVLIFTHMKFKPSIDAMELFDSGQWDLPTNLIMTIFDKQDAVGIGLYPNLSEGSRAHHGLLNMAGKMNILDGNPHVQFFSLENSTRVWPLSFEKPLVQKDRWDLSEDMIKFLRGLNSELPGSRPRSQRSV